MSAEAIAKVVADLRYEGEVARAVTAGDERIKETLGWGSTHVIPVPGSPAERAITLKEVTLPPAGWDQFLAENPEVAADVTGRLDALCVIDNPIVIDCTALRRQLVDNDIPVRIYDACLVPPFNEAVFAAENEYGNVYAMHCTVVRYPDEWDGTWTSDDHAIEWSRVRWVIFVSAFLGGSSTTKNCALRTCGPIHMWSIAVYEDGTVGDYRWRECSPEFPHDGQMGWLLALLVRSLDFLNCRNVEIVEPHRERHERKRIARTGVTVRTINVFPVGRTSRSDQGEPVGGVPMHTVRGHLAHYGPQYGRGLLFGKYAGRFFIPQHVAGNRGIGEVEADYKLVPE